MTAPLVPLFVFFILSPPLHGAAEETRAGAIGTRKGFLEAPQEESSEAGDHPATGIWKGTVRGSGLFVPEEGLPIRLWVAEEPENGEGLGVTLAIQGFDLQEAAATYESEARTLRFECTAPNGIPILYEVGLDGEKARGSARSTGFKIALELERLTTAVFAEQPAPSTPVDPKTLTTDDWRADLDYLRDHLPQVHLDAFHRITKGEWHTAVGDLRGRIEEYESERIAVAMARIVARIGDSHTGLHWRETGNFQSFPVRVLLFEGGVHVVAVDERYGEALCARIVGIGGHPIGAVLEAVSSVFSAENEHWKRAQAPALLIVPRLLYQLGLIDSPDRLPLSLELDGERFGIILGPSGSGEWLQAPDPRFERMPRWLQRQKERYWSEVLGEEKALYFAYNSCADDPKKPMAAFLDQLIDTYEQAGAERLILDLRNNSGGNSTVLGNHIARLADHESIGGRISCLIGPRTYSSGMLNAYQLRQEADALLIGEPTGGKPNSYGEVRSFRLPHSGFKVFYSTKYFRLLKGEDPAAVLPDVEVALEAQEFFAGEDPVLEAALRAR